MKLSGRFNCPSLC